MDYEKMYKEAVGKIQELLEEKKKKEMTNCLFEGELNEIFSELREGKEEKIRKAMIKYFTNGKEYLSLTPYSREDYIAWLEKQGEQVKPKLKIGDWIISNITGFVYIVKDKGYGGYIVANRENHQYTISTDKEKDYRLWTIQDAKDGDVLVSESNCGLNTWYCIFKSLDGDESMTVHCYLSRDGRFETKKELCFDKDPYSTKPATKEQRDLLFQKMKEAGYEWDAEKKELIKIEQKPSEWSEEDEENFKWFDKFFRAESVISEGKDIPQDRYLWFKNLKGRVQPKPKQEWSDEDNEHIKSIISTIECSKAQFPNAQAVLEAYNSDLIWLKSLRPQTTWKPTEEQIRVVARLRHCLLEDVRGNDVVILDNLLEQLKAL